MRRDAKIDGTQKEIVAALKNLGFSVLSLAPMGKGVPDLVVARGGKTWMIEVKNPDKKWKLTAAQKKFHGIWKDNIFIFESANDITLLR